MSIKPYFLYLLVFIYVIIIIFIFTAGDKGIVIIGKKEEELKIFKERSRALNAEIKQIKIDIERLKTDKEYLIASAKIYGYFENDNEKVIKIIEKNKEKYPEAKEKPQNVYTEGSRVYGMVLFFAISFLCVLFCIFVRNKTKKAALRQTQFPKPV